ncbi:glycosyltransferase family 4 protein [Flavobacteriaceae bacterium GSB9]|nr:glycosyltransferase family 4 protein [Flavobacteriaceae bacterium GSB9]
MKRLLYITNQIFGPGGLERVLSIKASGLAEDYNYKVHILTLNQNNKNLFYKFSKKITYHNIEANGHPIKYLKTYRNGIKSIIKKVAPDIVLVCDDGLKGLLLPLIIGKPCPMIYERHVSKNIELKFNRLNLIEKIKAEFKFKLMDFGASLFDAFIVLTQGNTKEWHTKNLHVIPNPLSFYPKEPSSLKNKKVIAVGKQCFQKGYDRLLKSWKTVNEKHPDWILDIYGTINKNEGLNILVNELGISESVNFFEPVRNITDKYKEASIYVMSSRYEGFGMVLTEAMAYGVPCISFDCPHGPSDIINNGADGFLVPNSDINALSDKINLLIEHEALRFDMGEKARENVKRYLPKTIMNQWDALFKHIMINRK